MYLAKKFLLILDLWGVSFHTAVIFGLVMDFVFKSTLGHCADAFTQRRDFSYRFLPEGQIMGQHTMTAIEDFHPKSF